MEDLQHKENINQLLENNAPHGAPDGNLNRNLDGNEPPHPKTPTENTITRILLIVGAVLIIVLIIFVITIYNQKQYSKVTENLEVAPSTEIPTITPLPTETPIPTITPPQSIDDELESINTTLNSLDNEFSDIDTEIENL